jgi:hypothetical protein
MNIRENLRERHYEIARQLLAARELILDNYTFDEVVNAAPDVDRGLLHAYANILTGEKL